MRSETAGFGDVRAAAAPRAGDGRVVRDDLSVAGGSRESSAEVFTRLYEESHGRIYNLAARILNDRDQAADVTQDVFLATYKRLPELPQDVNMERWMYRVTVNACFDLMRRRHRRGEPVAHDVDGLPDHIDPYERAELTRAVESALSALSPRHRTALVLKDLHGFGNGEIAEIMGISRGSAGVLLLRARAAFRRAFGHAQPAGGKSVAGVGLAVLPMLPIPASLEAPSFLTGSALATAALAPSAAAASLSVLASSGAAPAVAGIGGGLGAATVAKVALVAVGAFALVGGGIAAVTTQPDSAGRAAGAVVAGATVAGTTANGNNHFAPRDDLAAERLQRERARTDGDAEAGSGGARDGAGGDGGRSATQSGESWSGPTLSTGRRADEWGSESGGSASSGAAGTDGGGASAAGQSGAAGAAAGTSSGGAAGDGSGSADAGGSL